MINNKTTIFIILIALAVVVAACNSTANTTPAPQGSATNTAPTGAVASSPPEQVAPMLLADSPYAKISYLISEDPLSDNATKAMTGFSMQKTLNQDGSTTYSLTSTNPEYHDQTYTLQSGQKLYFIERYLPDDNGSNDSDSYLGDDNCIIVDSNDVIIQGPDKTYTTPPPRSAGQPRGNFTNMTDAQRQQLRQVMIDACSGKQENDSCNATGPQGDMNGTCMTRNDTLSCAVYGRPPGQPTQ